jgi:uridylate kinase
MRSDEDRVYVIKLSGSLFFSSEFDPVVRAISGILRQDKTIRIVAVAGGGEEAREYIGAASKFGADQASLDQIGIQISRLNALVLAIAFNGLAPALVPDSLDKVVEILGGFSSSTGKQRYPVVICGGFHPGQSTNAVAALISEKIRARMFINATDVDGVFDKDPRKFNDAKMFQELDSKKLSELLGEGSVGAGFYDLMDPVALRLLSRSRIPAVIVKCEPGVIKDLLLGQKSHGTEITYPDLQ